VHGHHDYVAAAGRDLEARQRAAGLDCARVGYPPAWGGRGRNPIWMHGVHGASEQLVWHWLAGVADLRQRLGAIPPMALWPVEADGLRWPDERCLESLHGITPASGRLTLAGARVAIARPAAATAPRALVLCAINRFETDPVQAELDGECLASHGLLAVTAHADGQEVTSALAAAQADLACAPGLPWILAVDQPRALAAQLALRPQPPLAVIIFHAETGQVREA